MFDQKVAMVASRQHGLISRDQVFELRGSREMIRHRVERGRWRLIHHGVFAIAGAPETVEFALMAACLAGGDGSAVSHRSAVQLWSARPFGTTIEVTTPRETGRLTSAVVIHRSRDLAPDHVTRHDQLPVTTPVRTLVDLGQVAPVWEVKQTVESFLTKHLVTMPTVRAAIVLHSRQGRRGVGVLRRAIENRALGDLPAKSVLEALFADLCQEAGIPPPLYQHQMVFAGRDRFIDFCYPELLLAIEVDGYEFHSTRDQFEEDRIRGNELVLHGWQVLHFTWTQVLHRRGYVGATLKQARRKLGA